MASFITKIITKFPSWLKLVVTVRVNLLVRTIVSDQKCYSSDLSFQLNLLAMRSYLRHNG